MTDKQYRQVEGRTMAYVEIGEGDPIVFLHGNPDSSYGWRNVIPHVADLGRCIAPDLIGMGDSDKLPDSGPDSYRFVEHRRYLDALLEALDVRERVTLVVHDWGSALGFDWANRHRDAVKGIVYLEALVRPLSWDEFEEDQRGFYQALRSPAGEAMVLEQNLFGVEQLLPSLVLRELSEAGDGGLPAAVFASRRGPAPNPGLGAPAPGGWRAGRRDGGRQQLRGLAQPQPRAQAVHQRRARGHSDRVAA